MADNSTVSDTKSELYLLFGVTGMYGNAVSINIGKAARSFSRGSTGRNWADLVSAEPI